MLMSEIVTNIPTGCNCEVAELPNQVKGGVKGYGLIVECDVCKTKMEAQNIIQGKQRRKQEILTELNQLDLKDIRPLMEKEDSKVLEIKAQKDVLRVEFNSL